ncbi:MAG: cation:proton antiporter, partial [Microgenomates group bacterium]
MGEVSYSVVFNFFIFLLLPFIFGALAKKLKLPPLIGYVIGGLVYGSFFSTQANSSTIANIAYFGILLLLFTVGLETNFSRILSFKRIILIAGTLQILLSIFFITIISLFFNFSLLTSFLIGIALSSSSTTLVAKIIQDRGEEASFLGEMAIGILLFQDIAFIPFMIIFTSITSGQQAGFLQVFFEIILSLIKSGFIIAVLFYLGQKVVPPLFARIAKSNRELFNLFIILFIFFVTTFSLFLGIPSLIGVFIAGILLAQTIEHHQIFSQIRPLRDLLAVIFFVYIGTSIKFFSELNLLPQIFLFTFLVILVKALIIFFIFVFLRFHSKISYSLSMYLFQIDEDAFILMSTAFLNQLISKEDYNFVITAVLITLILTPLMIKNKDHFYNNLRALIKKYLPFLDKYLSHRLDSNISPIDELEIKDHVVICGYGRIGSYIGRSLMIANIPYIAIDYNRHLVEKARKEGVNIIYGDPSDIDILDYAQVDEAAVLVLAV